MRRIIVDYAKLTNDILSLLVEKFPDGYEESDIIRFKNAQNELIEAVEVRTEDTIYLVKVSKKLLTRIENFEEEEEDDIDTDVEVITPVKGIDMDDDMDDDETHSKKLKMEEEDEEDDDYDNDSSDEDEDEDDY